MTQIEEVLETVKKIGLLNTMKINYGSIVHYHISNDSLLATISFEIHTDKNGHITRVIFYPGFYSYEHNCWFKGRYGLEKSLGRHPKLAFLLDIFKSL